MKVLYKSWNRYEIAWLFTFSSIALLLTIIWGDHFFGFSVFLTGVLCVVLAAKGNILTYIFGMYNTFGYAFTAYQNGLFGEVMLNALFFVPMNIVGFIMWKKNTYNNTLKMRQMSVRKFLCVIVISIIGIEIMGFLLSFIQTQNTPYIDSATNILSIAATILMIKRYKEQWLVYIVLNIFTVIMWLIRIQNGAVEGAMMVVMWSAYLINSVYGYYIWNKGAKEALQ